ncbi:MAG: aminodeoxychorismate/anthranilate synthase component II [Peptococcaceae bacterium]|nr:aminodeoxychorismate/anthranilate synthase component II [Peptococcaceae bacterium]
MILIIDNYDSFTYNLYQIAGQVAEQLGNQPAGQFGKRIADQTLKVIRNDEMDVEEIVALNPSHIIISPGPGRPRDAGICEEVIQYFSNTVDFTNTENFTKAEHGAPPPPILGICLGHQAVCEAFGAQISYAQTLMHGKKSLLHIANGSPLFRGLPPLIEGGLYHSLAAKRDTLPDKLLVIAETDTGEVMGVKHRDYPLFGLQFHPESILTSQGERIIENFLRI